MTQHTQCSQNALSITFLMPKPAGGSQSVHPNPSPHNLMAPNSKPNWRTLTLFRPTYYSQPNKRAPDPSFTLDSAIEPYANPEELYSCNSLVVQSEQITVRQFHKPVHRNIHDNTAGILETAFSCANLPLHLPQNTYYNLCSSLRQF